MKIKIISALLLVVMVVAMLAGCSAKDEPLTKEKAYAVVYDHAGVKEADVLEPHLHVLSENGVVTYNIHFTANNIDYDYTIDSKTGEILTHTP